MNNQSFRNYIREISCILKDNAKKAKLDADHPNKSDSAEFNSGFLMAYHQVIATMKNQAPLFDLDQEEIGLADIEPERDLL